MAPTNKVPLTNTGVNRGFVVVKADSEAKQIVVLSHDGLWYLQQPLTRVGDFLICDCAFGFNEPLVLKKTYVVLALNVPPHPDLHLELLPGLGHLPETAFVSEPVLVTRSPGDGWTIAVTPL